MPSLLRKIANVFIDLTLAAALFWLSAFLARDGRVAPEQYGVLLNQMLLALGTLFVLSMLWRGYNSLRLYIGFNDVLKQLLVSVMTGTVLLICKFAGVYSISGSHMIIFCVLFFVFSTAVRAVSRTRRWIVSRLNARPQNRRRLVIVGSNVTASALIERMQEHPEDGWEPVACVDQSARFQGMTIGGVPVTGSLERLPETVARTGAEEIVIALPDADNDTIRRIYEACKPLGLPVKLFRSSIDLADYLQGDRRALQEIALEDLLSRETVLRDMSEVARFIGGKTVMVTGGAGSIGTELCRQLLKHGCGHLVIVDISENALFEINEELNTRYPPECYSLCVASVRDKPRIDELMERFRPALVFHAAAHKHVPMMELNPFEAVKNNVIGTENVIRSCLEHGVRRFVLISTDKAVNPANVMGATKRAAELLVQIHNSPSCEMCAVRFGNVLGSNGSVIPTFRKQIAEGGPVRVTSREMMRYFMTIPEAVSLVLTAGTLAAGGEIFVLDMGKPVRIYEMAEDLIRMSGYVPHKDIKIEIVGLRPGEKLFEEIALNEETVDATRYDKIFVIRDCRIDREALLPEIERLKQAGTDGADEQALRTVLFGITGRA